MIDVYAGLDSFKLLYEKFLAGCDIQEENAWNVAEDGEMDSYFVNDLSCVIIRLIAADGRFDDREVRFFNRALGFDYDVKELEAVYADCRERIDAVFETGVSDSLSRLEGINPRLAETYRELLRTLCAVILESDGTVSPEEKADAERLRGMLA